MKYLISFILFFNLIALANAQFANVVGPAFTTSSVPNLTVANLPTCNAGSNGLIVNVTNALAPTIALAVVGGGAVTILVHCNGTNFIVG